MQNKLEKITLKGVVMQITKLKAPFGWVGGKSRLAKDIVSLMPNHTTYIEVFGGALSVLYTKERSKVEIVNDINSELINLHRAIRNNPQTLQMYLNQLFISRELFKEIKKEKLKPRNHIEKAAFYLYLITQSFGSKGEHFAMIKKGRKPKNIYKSYAKWSNRLKGVIIENMSFSKLITQYDSKEAFFYLDPPYVSTEHYYKNTGGFGQKEHEELANLLKDIDGKFLLSYNDCSLVRELYKDFNIISSKEIRYSLNNKNNSKKVKEIFITNYDI